MEDNFAVVFTQPGVVTIEKQNMPVMKSGQVLIKTSCSLISSGTELTMLCKKNTGNDSIWSKIIRYPIRPGYSNIGQVVDVASDVDRSWIGKKVATCSCHSSYVVCDNKFLRPVPEHIQDDEASFFCLAEIAMNSVRRSGLSWGESVVVFGAGLLGQLVVMISLYCGARPVFLVDISDYRLNIATKHPSVHTVNSISEIPLSAVKDKNSGRLADVVFEATGNADLIPEEFHVLRKQGRFILLSSPSGKTQFDFHDLCNFPSYTIIGTHNDSHPTVPTLDNPWTNLRHAELFFSLLLDGSIQVKQLISHNVRFDEAPQLYQELMVDKSRIMGAVIWWN